MSDEKRISRLAPSPTGALHLGNARTFFINWAIARQRGWELRMRIEDLDGPRNKPDADREALDVLNWLGLDHDGEPLVQSADFSPYRSAMQVLASKGLTYSCSLSRKEVEAAASPPLEQRKGEFGREVHFPEDLRPGGPGAAARFRFAREDTNYRLVVEREQMTVHDEVLGELVQSPFNEVGDFVIWTRRSEPAYQLAVVVDDARQGVTDVVRGDDLLRSVSRQSLLYRALELPEPRWWHLPLVIGPDGRKLAKRHGDTKLSSYRDAGVQPERVIGLLASWSGIGGKLREMSAADFRDGFVLDNLDRQPIVFTQEHHQWLLGS